MQFRYMSDLHTETNKIKLTPTPEDKSQVLLLAGDIGNIYTERSLKNYMETLRDFSNMFKEVILILGNHEHYKGSIKLTASLTKELLREEGLGNVVLLDNEPRIYHEENIVVIGTTLWTETYNTPIDKLNWELISDSSYISTGSSDWNFERNFSYNDLRKEYQRCHQYLLSITKKYKDDGFKVIWLIHHAPSRKSLHRRYIGDPLSSFFINWRLEGDIYDLQPNLIIHGHTHDSFDYTLEETRVLCNPRGVLFHYPNTHFNEGACINL